MTIPTPTYKRIKTTLLFNKVNGIFITAIAQPLEGLTYDQNAYIPREVLFNLRNDIVDGDLTIDEEGNATDNFEVVAKTDLNKRVYEKTLNLETGKKITDDYPIVTQLNVIGKALSAMGGANATFGKLPAVKALIAMVEAIDAKLAENQVNKEKLEQDDSVIYISDEKLEEINALKLTGLPAPTEQAASPRIFKTD